MKNEVVVENSSSEHGGIIISDTDPRVWPKVAGGGKLPIALKALTDDVIVSTIDSCSMDGITWYNGKAIAKNEFILADVTQLTLAGGTVQAIYGKK